jgi:hypothetical protein
MLNEAHNHGSNLSKLEWNLLITHTICQLWKEEGAHYPSTGTSSNPTKVVGHDSMGKCR